MRFAISTPNMGPIADLLELAREAEAAGWDGLFVWDHLHLDRQQLFAIHDPWVLLGAMAPYTSRMRLGPLVTPLARRRPWVVAKQVVTLDHLTEGRAIFGVGLGYPPAEEFGAFGDATDDRLRADLLDEGLELITALWTGDIVDHSGAHYRVGAQFQPLPVQQPRPPIWVAGMWPNRRPLERATRYDGVVPVSSDGEPLGPDTIAEVVAVTGTRAGFDVIAIGQEGVPAQEYADAGATWLVVSSWPHDGYLADLRATARNGPTR
jgi:alkanesulfonate monooxygenase SsuD/methylene tetrahydromethanopterin reductase-like flavin-dependent oxidoreductase (luciferase family)